jgi:hypothetical protein
LPKGTDVTTGLTTLGQALSDSREPLWDASLLLPFDRRWDLDTPAFVAAYAEDPVDNDSVVVDGVKLERAIGVNEVHGVFLNASLQLGEGVSLDQLLKAFLSYYDNDAFIDFGASD